MRTASSGHSRHRPSSRVTTLHGIVIASSLTSARLWERSAATTLCDVQTDRRECRSRGSSNCSHAPLLYRTERMADPCLNRQRHGRQDRELRKMQVIWKDRDMPRLRAVQPYARDIPVWLERLLRCPMISPWSCARSVVFPLHSDRSRVHYPLDREGAYHGHDETAEAFR